MMPNVINPSVVINGLTYVYNKTTPSGAKYYCCKKRRATKKRQQRCSAMVVFNPDCTLRRLSSAQGHSCITNHPVAIANVEEEVANAYFAMITYTQSNAR